MKINEETMKEMDFGFLEGRKIKLIGLAIDEGVIIGCDYNVGISIMDIDKTEYLMCFRGPSVRRRFNIPNNQEENEYYDNEFCRIINDIINYNQYDHSIDLKSRNFDIITGDKCAFV